MASETEGVADDVTKKTTANRAQKNGDPNGTQRVM
jgi:hypothetical protein